MRTLLHVVVATAALLSAAAPVPAAPPDADLSGYAGQLAEKIDLRVDAPLEAVLRAIDEQASLEMIVSRAEIQSRLDLNVSISARQITVREALDLAASAAGVDWDIRDGKLLISSPSVIYRPYFRVHVYDVRTLTQGINDLRTRDLGRQELPGAVDHYRSNIFADDGPGFDLAAIDPGGAADVAGIAADDLIAIVKAGAVDGLWNLDGVSAAYNRGLLTVVQTPSTHQAVAQTLADLHEAYGKMIAVQGLYLVVPRGTVDRLVAANEGRLLFAPDKVEAAKRTLTSDAGARVLGSVRTITMNAQKVSLMAGHEDMSMSDLEPVVATDATAFDPVVTAHSRSAVLDVRATADFNNEKVTLEVLSNIVAGAERRTHAGNVMAIAPGEVIEVRDEQAMDEQAERARQREAFGDKQMAQTALFELTAQDITKYRTTVRIPTGGAALLAGGSDQFTHIADPEKVEVVLLIEARVMQ